jgi:hypothetical protein
MTELDPESLQAISEAATLSHGSIDSIAQANTSTCHIYIYICVKLTSSFFFTPRSDLCAVEAQALWFVAASNQSSAVGVLASTNYVNLQQQYSTAVSSFNSETSAR